MSRSPIPPLTVLLALLAASPATAFETLEDVACVCAEDVLNTGDYVSCFAHLSRRLVAKDRLSATERARAVADASTTDLEALAADCPSGAADWPSGWGVSLETDSPFYQASPFTGRTPPARAVLRQWNLSGRDAFQVNPNGGQPECQYSVRIVDRTGRVLRREFVTCGPTFHAKDLPAGTDVSAEFEVPLETLNSEGGQPDGTPLAGGVYRIEATWSRQGPQAVSVPVTEGGRPHAGVAIRILD